MELIETKHDMDVSYKIMIKCRNFDAKNMKLSVMFHLKNFSIPVANEYNVHFYFLPINRGTIRLIGKCGSWTIVNRKMWTWTILEIVRERFYWHWNMFVMQVSHIFLLKYISLTKFLSVVPFCSISVLYLSC